MESDVITVIRARRGVQLLDIREIWGYRELLLFFVWRNLTVRYRQTLVGVAWAVLQPLALMSVFAIFFGRLARMPSDGIPYAIFVLSAITPWQFFERTLSDSSNSVVRDQRLISKVYFPRVMIPFSAALSAVVDFVIALALLACIMLIYGHTPTSTVVFLPLFLVLLFVTSLGLGLWFSALNVQYRDIQHVLPFLLRIWFFLTPVVYPTALVPEQFRVLYMLNPMVAVVEGFRWALLGTAPPQGDGIVLAAVLSGALFVGGLFFFRSRERYFADSLG